MSTSGDDHLVTEWAFAAGRGDRGAMESFIRATQADVWRFICYLSDAGRADDLTQETFIRALRSLPRFSGRSTARTWLLSIARRVVVDDIRRETSRPRVAHDDVEAAATAHPSGTHGHAERVEWEMLIAGLDAERREALLLTQILGFTYTEAAQVCGCPVGTIRSRVARARDELQAAARADDRAI